MASAYVQPSYCARMHICPRTWFLLKRNVFFLICLFYLLNYLFWVSHILLPKFGLNHSSADYYYCHCHSISWCWLIEFLCCIIELSKTRFFFIFIFFLLSFILCCNSRFGWICCRLNCRCLKVWFIIILIHLNAIARVGGTCLKP